MSGSSGTSALFLDVKSEPVSSIKGSIEEKMCPHCPRPVRLHHVERGKADGVETDLFFCSVEGSADVTVIHVRKL